MRPHQKQLLRIALPSRNRQLRVDFSEPPVGPRLFTLAEFGAWPLAREKAPAKPRSLAGKLAFVPVLLHRCRELNCADDEDPPPAQQRKRKAIGSVRVWEGLGISLGDNRSIGRDVYRRQTLSLFGVKRRVDRRPPFRIWRSRRKDGIDFQIKTSRRWTAGGSRSAAPYFVYIRC